jgi:outer membrane protein assembly factor BamB
VLIIRETAMIYPKNAVLAVVALAGTVQAQISFLNAPERKWSTIFSPMGHGNGIVVAPNSDAVYATSSNGSVGAFSHVDGSKLWTYKPTSDGLIGNGGVSVAVDGSYLVYGYTENFNRLGESW